MLMFAYLPDEGPSGIFLPRTLPVTSPEAICCSKALCLHDLRIEDIATTTLATVKDVLTTISPLQIEGMPEVLHEVKFKAPLESIGLIVAANRSRLRESLACIAS